LTTLNAGGKFKIPTPTPEGILKKKFEVGTEGRSLAESRVAEAMAGPFKGRKKERRTKAQCRNSGRGGAKEEGRKKQERSAWAGKHVMKLVIGRGREWGGVANAQPTPDGQP